MKMSKAERDTFFNGKKDENRKSIERGVVAIRGLKAAEDLKALGNKLLEVRAHHYPCG